MLSMGFAKELKNIMRFVPRPPDLLFSATIPPDIKRYAKRYMHEPEFLSLIEENVASDDVSHRYYMVSGVGRPRDLVKVIDFEQPQSAIIFCNTRKETELVARYLQKHDLDGEYLNSDLSQRDRERIMKRMKEKTLRFLVATDIAARGIDISQLSHVINYVLPESPEVYIHRTGRTGRAGVKGTAISLIGPREIGVYYYLRRIYQVALEEKSLPTKAEIELQRSRRTSDKLAQEIKSSALTTPDKAAATDAAKLLERDDAQDLVAILLDHYRSGPQLRRRMCLQSVVFSKMSPSLTTSHQVHCHRPWLALRVELRLFGENSVVSMRLPQNRPQVLKRQLTLQNQRKRQSPKRLLRKKQHRKTRALRNQRKSLPRNELREHVKHVRKRRRA